MSQWLGILAGLPDDTGSPHSTHTEKLIPEVSNKPFWPLQTPALTCTSSYTDTLHTYN